MKPLFFKESLKDGNENSNVAICTLWTEKEKIIRHISKNSYCVCGNLYSVQGISYLIKNVLANPKIRYIILCGRDLSFGGDAFVNFMNNGIDEKGNIIGSYGSIDTKIGKENLEKFRKNVKLLDMRGKETEINSKIRELKPLEPFSEPIILEDKEEKEISINNKHGSFTITEKTVARAWLKMLDIIMKYGEDKPTEFGIKHKEVLNMIVVIEEGSGTISPWLNITDEELQKYYPTILTAKRIADVKYTYGERLFNHPMNNIGEEWKKESELTFNQVQNAVEHLKKAPHTRRAIAFTWNVAIDSASESPPCLTQVSWNIYNGKLYQTNVFRSHDIYGAWPMNMYAMRELQKKVAKDVGVKIGSLISISNSAHVYENKWEICKNTIKNHYSGKDIKFELEGSGYFIIFIENNEIVAQHCLSDGKKTNLLFKGKTAEELYRRILNENIINRLDHAAYLGRELTKAETAIILGKKFIQDKPIC